MISPERRHCECFVKYCTSVYEQGSERERACACVCDETDIQMKLKGFQYSGIAEHQHLAEMKNNKKVQAQYTGDKAKEDKKKKEKPEFGSVCASLGLRQMQMQQTVGNGSTSADTQGALLEITTTAHEWCHTLTNNASLSLD